MPDRVKPTSRLAGSNIGSNLCLQNEILLIFVWTHFLGKTVAVGSREEYNNIPNDNNDDQKDQKSTMQFDK